MSIKPSNNNKTEGMRHAMIRHKSSSQAVLNHIWAQKDRILRYDYFPVKGIVQKIAAFHLDQELMAAAREVMRPIKANQKALDNSYYNFGFRQPEPDPLELGILYELLPREVALKLFIHNYFVMSQKTITAANKILIHFSCARAAAEFVFDLWIKHPHATNWLISQPCPESTTFPSRRYEKTEFLKELERKRGR